jgi:hypothetical protein
VLRIQMFRIIQLTHLKMRWRITSQVTTSIRNSSRNHIQWVENCLLTKVWKKTNNPLK